MGCTITERLRNTSLWGMDGREATAGHCPWPVASTLLSESWHEVGTAMFTGTVGVLEDPKQLLKPRSEEWHVSADQCLSSVVTSSIWGDSGPAVSVRLCVKSCLGFVYKQKVDGYIQVSVSSQASGSACVYKLAGNVGVRENVLLKGDESLGYSENAQTHLYICDASHWLW